MNYSKFMQANKIIHRDLKLDNFLVGCKNKEKKDYIIKLGNYGKGKFERRLF